MQKIREQHGLNSNPQIIKPKQIFNKNNMQMEADSSSDLSSDDDDD